MNKNYICIDEFKNDKGKVNWENTINQNIKFNKSLGVTVHKSAVSAVCRGVKNSHRKLTFKYI